ERTYVVRQRSERAEDGNRRRGRENPEGDLDPATLEARRTEDGRRDEERQDSRRVLELERRLVAVVREEVDRQIRHGPEHEQRLAQPQSEKREEQQGEIGRLVPGGNRLDKGMGIREQ